MRSMEINRRQLLGLMMGGLAASASIPAFAKPANLGSSERLLFVGCKADAARQNAVAGFDPMGQMVFEFDLEKRGHGLAVSPDNRVCAVFARRPGEYISLISLPDGREITQAFAPQGRHQQGHGVFSADGKYLFTTENNYDAGHGVIGIYQDGKRLGEFHSQGIEPHEILLSKDQRTLIVANGGIRTHPDSGRARLNLAEMQSNLVLLDAQSGALKAKVELPKELHLVSMRHLVEAPDGAILAVNQHQGADTDHVPLLVRWHDNQLTPLFAPKDVQANWRNYVGGVTLDASGQMIAASLPRSNRVAYFSTAGEFLGTQDVRDGCGVAAGVRAGTFVTGSGFGGARVMGPNQDMVDLDDRWVKSQRWDNHLMLVRL